MDFKELCSLLESVKEANGQAEKQKILQTKFKQFIEFFHNNPVEFFQIFRLLVPKLDRDRNSYNMKEAKISRTLIKMLDLPPGNDKNVLSKSYLLAKYATDFGDVVYSVIRKFLSNTKTTLTVEELNKQLDELTKRGTDSETEEILFRMFKKCSAEDIRWIIRIILKDLKLGVSANTILNCYHKDAASFYASNNNLKKVCEVLANQNVRLHELEIEIFEAFRPMLSKRIDNNNFKKEFKNDKLYYLENKFDGERFQVHMKNGEFRYFSRNGFDFTEQYGKSYDSGGIFTPKLRGLFRSTVENIILDGEMMLWNKKTNKFGSKGMAYDVKKLNKDSWYQPCFCIYDIILINNKVLTNSPIKERLKVLNKVFEILKQGTICLSEVKEVWSRKEIIDALNESFEKEEEGIIVKDPDSVYKYSDRNSGWYKMKLEYFQDVMNDLDLILMGGVYTSLSDTLNSFLVGIRSGSTKNGKPLFHSFAKVASGLNYEESKMIDKKLKTQGKKFEHYNTDQMIFGKEKPHYYIDPENSLVFTIRATELIRNTDGSFKTPYTLRFPRILAVRDDKPTDECLSINELLELTSNNKHVIKLNKRRIELDEIMSTKIRKIKKHVIEMPEIFDSEVVSDILQDFNIYVFSGTSEFSKEKAESSIKKAGGKVIYRVSEKVDIILVDKHSEYVTKLIKEKRKLDIVNISWLQRVLEDGNLLGYEQEEVYYLGANYKNTLAGDLDMYGDSYTEPTTPEKLKETFRIINEMGDYLNQNRSIRFNECRSFEKYYAYFDKFATPNDPQTDVIYDSFLDELEFKYYNGNICDSINQNVNIVIFNSDNRKDELYRFLESINKTDVKIVSKQFIYE